jgi:hypothetical protein
LARAHTLGIDDGPFDKFASARVPIVGVMMEGPDLVEAVARTEFAVDGDGVTEFLADWVRSLRFHPALQAVFLGGITIAGLGVIDIRALSDRLGVPVLAVNRRDPSENRVGEALAAAGLEERAPLLEATPPPVRVDDHLFVACAGASADDAVRLVRASRAKSEFPEPLRLAHVIARAYAAGESRGRP